MKRQLENKLTEAGQQTPQEQFIFNLLNEIAPVMAEMREGKEVGDALRNYKSQLVNYQSYYKKIKWATVRFLINF